MTLNFGPRRGIYVDITEKLKNGSNTLNDAELAHFETFDLIYRSLCALMYNYVPTSGHPGGSISSGRFVAGLIYDTLDFDFSDPDRIDADILSYAAGHKALGLYSMWALRNEIVRLGAADLLPKDEKYQLRLEDLLGFRRNPIQSTPLFKKFRSKPLDGHPTPATPFVKLSTGASGVGLASSLGLAFGATDHFGKNAPRIHIVEGEGGMTPGRVIEAFASAGTSSLSNALIHIDWNQASIDSNHVCRDGSTPGDYVQWTPMEYAYLNDWNVVYVPDGKDFRQIIAAQRLAKTITNNQPTVIVYRTIKGWQYGIEGRASHGAGHKLCSDGFYNALSVLITKFGSGSLPKCEAGKERCKGGTVKEVYESCFWEALGVIRNSVTVAKDMHAAFAGRIGESKKRLDALGRKPREGAPTVERVYELAAKEVKNIPQGLKLTAGTSVTLRGELGHVLNYYNKVSNGAFLTAAADLLGSTSVSEIAKGFGEGYFNANSNPTARLLSTGGICEDAMSGILTGLSTFGYNIGVGSSYGAFLAPLGHIAARLHAIGGQSRHAIKNDPYKPVVLVCAHAGIKTGEDGPTHADPQALQLFEGNFPKGTMITLTPWDPQELWVLISQALAKRPAVIAPFVTRPSEIVLDRESLGLAPVTDAANGVYLLRKARGKSVGTLVLQESGVTYSFLTDALPRLIKDGIELDVYYVSSVELFELLPSAEQEKIFPESVATTAMGITGFTLPTMYKFIRSQRGIAHTLYPFRKGHFLGSGQAEMVLCEAGLDGESQYKAISEYLS